MVCCRAIVAYFVALSLRLSGRAEQHLCVWSVSIPGMIGWGRRGYVIRTELYVKQKGDCNVSLPDMPIRPSSYYATADEGDMDQMSRSRAVAKMVSIGYGYM